MASRWMRELFGPGRGSVLVFCWLGWVFDFFDLILFAFVKGDIAQELGLELTTDIAWIEGLTLAATAVGGLGFGRLADRHGRRAAISLSILVYSLGAVATAGASDFSSLLVARVVTGLGVGGEWGVGHAIVAETFPAAWRGRAAGILQAGSPVAMALAAAAACFTGCSWRTLFLVAGAPALLVCFARWAMPGPDRAPGRTAGALGDLFVGRLRRPSIALLAVLVLHMTGFWCTYAWLPSMLFREAGASKAFVGWFFITVNAVHVLADVGFGFLADRFGRRRMFVAFSLVFAGGLALVGVAHDQLRHDPLVFVAAFAAVGLGAGTWSCFGVLFATVYPEPIRATAACGFYNVARGAQLFSQPLMGWLLAATGTFASALFVGAVTAVLSAVAVLGVPVDQRTRPADQ